SLKTSIKTITYLSDIGCLEIQGASLILHIDSSPMLCNSSSRKLSLALTKAICQRFPNASVT
ncbi:hypothetical protein NP205_15730, partial [Salmonella enterica]|nr:hypothetical protein [Salmonella enterica]